MSILSFMDMTVVMCIQLSAIYMLSSLIYSGIGSLFIPRCGLILQVIAGMSVVASLCTICVSYSAYYAKYVIVFSTFVSFIIVLYRFKKRTLKIKSALISIIPVICIYLFIFLHIMYNVIPENGIFHYNCHLPYFSGVSIELLNADYMSRLRLMDVYPFEWSKYHFFYGSYIALPMLFFQKYNYLTFLFAKGVIISFLGGGVYELLRVRYGAKKAAYYWIISVAMLYICTKETFVWLMATTNLFTIAFLFITWLFFETERYAEASIFSICYAITKSGSIICGSLLFLYALYKMYEKKNIALEVKMYCREEFFSILIGLGIISMIISGEMPLGEEIKSMSIQGILEGIVSPEWTSILPLAFLMNFPHFTITTQWLFLIIMLFVIFVKRKWIYLRICEKYVLVLGIVFMVISCMMISLWVLKSMDPYKVFISYLIYYILPLNVIALLLNENSRKVFYVLLVGYALNFILFTPAVTMPNYSIIMLLLVVLSVRKIVDIIYGFRKCLNAASLIVLCYLTFQSYQNILFFSGDPYHEVLKMEHVSAETPFVYNSPSDADFAKLNALKGNRVYHKIMPDIKDNVMSHTSMSMRFLTKNN